MIICFSASHKAAKLPMLEALNILNADKFARTLLESQVIKECLVIQTCHRIEIFQVASDQNEAKRQTLKMWSIVTGVSLDLINSVLQEFEGKEALQHLFYLAAGLESVILGEDQILGQVHTAWLNANNNRTIGTILNNAFIKALSTGRKVRTETRVNEGCTSISSAAVDLAEHELGSLKSKKALLIGAGEAGSLVAENLKDKALSQILVTNRTYERSEILANKISGEAVPFENIFSTIPSVDLVITAVSVTQPLLKKEDFSSFVGGVDNPDRVLLIDISQPRAIAESVGLIQGINLKTIDDLKGLVARNLQTRENEATKCRYIISQELERFEAELSKMVVQPLITEICRKVEEIRKKELERAMRKLHETDKRKLSVIDRFSRELTERILHTPAEQLRAAALNNNGEILSAAEKIFQTNPEVACKQESTIL